MLFHFVAQRISIYAKLTSNIKKIRKDKRILVDSNSEAKLAYQLANRHACIEIHKYIITSKTF